MVFFRECRNGSLIVLERENHIDSRGTRLAVHQPLMKMRPSLLRVDKLARHPASWSYSKTKNVQPKGLSPDKYHFVHIQLSDFIHHTIGSLDDPLPSTMLGGKKTISTRLKPLLISRAFKPCENYFRDIPALPHIDEIPTMDLYKKNIAITDAERIPSLEELEGDSLGDIASFAANIPEWSLADEEAFLNALDAPSATSNTSSSIAIDGDLERQVYLDAAICHLEEVGVDPKTLKHSVQELMAAAVECNKIILTQVSFVENVVELKKKDLSFADGFDSHDSIVKAKTSELAMLDLEISKLQEKREALQKFLALDHSEIVKMKDELKLAKIDLQEAEEALSGEGIIFEKVSNEVEIHREKLRALPPLSPSF
ncbi:hypothetical protein ACFE04_018498 [Oxalis oulophora]